jgi:hypothetical protein
LPTIEYIPRIEARLSWSGDFRQGEQGFQGGPDRLARRRDELTGAILLRYEFGAATHVARQKWDTVLQTFVDHVWRVIDERRHHGQRARLSQECERLVVIEIRFDADGGDILLHVVREACPHVLGIPLASLPADEEKLKPGQFLQVNVVDCLEEGSDSFALLEPTEERKPLQRPATIPARRAAILNRGPRQVGRDCVAPDLPAPLAHPVDHVPARAHHHVGELDACAFQSLKFEGSERTGWLAVGVIHPLVRSVAVNDEQSLGEAEPQRA